MKVLITFALANEFAPWRKLRRFERLAADSSGQTYTATIGECEVRVVITGVGRFAAQRSLSHAFDGAPELCIGSGLCGGLKPDYAPGDVLAARAVAEAAGSRQVQCDGEMVTRALSAGAKVVDKFLVSDRVVATAAEKALLGATGDAVDMESVYVLAAAWQRGVRAVAIRAVSDSSESNLPLDFNRVFSERGEVSVARVVGQLVRSPGRLPGLLRLANESERAAYALANFLEAYLQRMEAGPFDESEKAEALAI
jgi:adenosylhomocysteine nucleosidase